MDSRTWGPMSLISMANSFGIFGKVKRLEIRSSVLGHFKLSVPNLESLLFWESLEQLYGSLPWWMMAATFLWGCIPREPNRDFETIDSRLVSIVCRDLGIFSAWTTGEPVQLTCFEHQRRHTTMIVSCPAPDIGIKLGLRYASIYLIHYNVEGKLVKSGEIVRSVSEPIRYAVNVFDRGEVDLEIEVRRRGMGMGTLEESRDFAFLEMQLFI